MVVQLLAQPTLILVWKRESVCERMGKVVLKGESIPHEVDWDEAITLYLVSDFVWSARKSSYQVVKKQWRENYMRYAEIEFKENHRLESD